MSKIIIKEQMLQIMRLDRLIVMSLMKGPKTLVVLRVKKERRNMNDTARPRK